MARLEDAAEAREDARQRLLLEHEERMEERREQREDERRQREQEHEERILSMFLTFFKQLSQQFQGSIHPPNPNSNSNSNPSIPPPSNVSTEPCATTTTTTTSSTITTQPPSLPSQPLSHAPNLPQDLYSQEHTDVDS